MPQGLTRPGPTVVAAAVGSLIMGELVLPWHLPGPHSCPGITNSATINPGGPRKTARAGGPRRRPGATQRAGSARAEQRTQHVLHDSAVAEILGLAWGVDPHDGPELLVVGAHRHLARDVSGVDRIDAGDVEHLIAGQQQRFRAVPRLELN